MNTLIPENNDVIYLSIETIQKILTRFLVEKNMPKEELAKKIFVTIEELERLLCGKNVSELIPKVNLPLIKFYCETRWA